MRLYDLVADTEPRYFSPGCVRARLALLTKGVPFETVEVRYHDLRFHWTEKLGVEKATGTSLTLPRSRERELTNFPHFISIQLPSSNETMGRS